MRAPPKLTASAGADDYNLGWPRRPARLTSRRFERLGWHSGCYPPATPDELPARSRGLRSAPAARRVAGRRAAGAADRHELGGGQRALDPARRRRRRDVPQEVPGPAAGAGAGNLQVESTHKDGTPP